jgi:hypothetical protein
MYILGGAHMPEEQVDIMEEIQNISKKWTDFKKTWVTHMKDSEFEVLEWNFAVGKQGSEFIVDMKAKVAVRQKKK